MKSYLSGLQDEIYLQKIGALYAPNLLPAVATLANGENTLGQKVGGTIGALAPMLGPEALRKNLFSRVGLPITASLLGRYLGGLVDPQKSV